MLKKTFPSPARSAGVALLLLSPLAYIFGVWLVVKYDAAARAKLAIDRNQAIAIASGVASSKGIDHTNWSSICWLKAENDLFYYQQLPGNEERELSKRVLPATLIAVLLRSPDRSDNFEVEMSVDGRVIGYSHKSQKSGEAEDAGEPAARKIAEEALQRRLATAGIAYSGELQLDAPPASAPPGPALLKPKGVNRKYTWKWPLSSIPELRLDSVLVVNGANLVSDRLIARVDPEFVRIHHNPRKWLKIVSLVAFCLVVAISVIFGVYRFVQRVRQKEVSYQRVIVLVLGFSAALSSFVLASDIVVAQVAVTPGFPLPDWVLQFSTSMFYLVIGLFVGMAYGGGEGDIREAYPGKLTSLDAFLVGKVFSRNVARSVVSGLAIGGWLMLSFQLSTLPWAVIPGKGEPINPLLNVWLGHFPTVAAFAAWPTDVMVIIVIGLLVPLPFFLRRKKLGRTMKMVLIFMFIWASCAAPYLDFRPWEGTLVTATVRAGLVLIAFLSFDLLTAIIAVAAPTFFSFTIGMATQPASSIRQSGLIAISLVVLALIVEFYFFFKGKVYSEEEVRPLYAGLLAERLSMQAEVSAASQAQQRLMPGTLPKSDYFSIAAKCLPAFEVGGDFYDVFELEPGKIGVLIAEGGGKGLGSALSIAFAKGFLMPKILGSKQTDDSPTEVIRGLQSRLATLLDEDSAVGLAYVVVDASDGRLRYARAGAFPLVMAGKNSEAEGLLKLEETEIKFSVRGDSTKHVTVIEGSFNLDQGDSVVIYTDGLAKNLQQVKNTPNVELAKVLKTSSEKSADELQRALTDSINKCSQRARKQGNEDDLTAVIVRLDKIENFIESNA